jgi:hypothetical protein
MYPDDESRDVPQASLILVRGPITGTDENEACLTNDLVPSGMAGV